MKKLLSIVMLVCCCSAYATDNSNSFQMSVLNKGDKELVKFQAPVSDDFSLAFYVDYEAETATPVLSKNGQNFQPISIRFCVISTDDCWRMPIYDEYLGDFANILDRKNGDSLVWQIEYIDNDSIAKTDLVSAPDVGNLGIFIQNRGGIVTHIDELGFDEVFIIWQSDLKDY
ncbi:hypothetical protein PT276_08895 [Orbaceae bacterium ESL0721]|nr:hypothetical protein [Orbaceae bacterium ESL0721]